VGYHILKQTVNVKFSDETQRTVHVRELRD
jgi:hypothetical protein